MDKHAIFKKYCTYYYNNSCHYHGVESKDLSVTDKCLEHNCPFWEQLKKDGGS